jgi:lipopolysaccharide/colanic/teichoic acid biosynthesis glycosyltransferase
MIRLFDILFSIIILIISLPFLIPIGLLLLFTGEGKVFYKQSRVGKNGKIFGLLKFATMLENSPNLSGGDITSGDDPRVLTVGKILRKTKVNEIPQIINIFLGEISIVGPRPLTPRNFALYDKSTQEIIKKTKPGLTGIGSIVFRDEESIIRNSEKKPLDCYSEDISPYKGKLERWFFDEQTTGNYFLLIFITAWVVLFPKSKLVWNIYSDLPEPPDSFKDQLNYS